MTNAPAFCPPALPTRIELLLQHARGPRLQITANLSRIDIRSRNHNVYVVRPAVHRVSVPTPMSTGFSDLRHDRLSLVTVEPTRIFRHSGSALECQHRVGELPAMLIFAPTAIIPRQPGAVRAPGQEVSERIGYDLLFPRGASRNPKNHYQPRVKLVTVRLGTHISFVESRVDADSYSIPSLTRRVIRPQSTFLTPLGAGRPICPSGGRHSPRRRPVS